MRRMLNTINGKVIFCVSDMDTKPPESFPISEITA